MKENECKIIITVLVYGLPIIDSKFEIEGYELKKEKINLTRDDFKNDLKNNRFSFWPFFIGLINIQEDYQPYFFYFEKKKTININYKKLSQERLKQITLDDTGQFIKVLRLKYNTRIIFPIISAELIQESTNKSLKFCFYPNSVTQPNINLKTFTKYHYQHLDFTKIQELENKNIKYNRSLKYFFSSFDPKDISIRYTLLFSSMEALLITSKKNITENLSYRMSKLLTGKKSAKKAKEISILYDKRSKYIHGSKKDVITENDEIKLRSIVRDILVIYYVYAYSSKLQSNQIIKSLDNNDDFNLQTKLAIESLKSKYYSLFFLKY